MKGSENGRDPAAVLERERPATGKPQASQIAALLRENEALRRQLIGWRRARRLGRAERRSAQIEAAIAAMPDALLVCDARGQVVEMNATAESIVGYTPEARSLPLLERIARIHPQTLDGAPLPAEQMPVARALRGETVHGMPLILEPAAHRRIWASVSAAPIWDSGKLAGAVTTFSYVTGLRELHEREEQLLLQVERRAAELDATISSIGEGIMIFDRAGELVRINQRAMEILNVPPSYPGSPVKASWEALHPETPEGEPVPAEQIPIYQALQGETVRLPSLVFHLPAGRTAWTSGSAAPIRMPGGQILGAIVAFVDFTAQHELQEQREDLLRGVSHDLRSPLTAVQGQAQRLLRALERAGLMGPERTAAEAILTGTHRMNAMIQDLVDSARLEAGQLKLDLRPIDLPAFVLDLKGRLASAMDSGRIHLEGLPPLPPVLADPDRLERILTNLLSNALKYSAPGTQVLVTIELEDGKLITSVVDHGPGIPPDRLPHLFQRYARDQTGIEKREGVGLGLYITRKLVEAHGGRIWAESRVGVGSKFSFSLPTAAEAHRSWREPAGP